MNELFNTVNYFEFRVSKACQHGDSKLHMSRSPKSFFFRFGPAWKTKKPPKHSCAAAFRDN